MPASSSHFLDEIVLWRRVQFIDISKEILYSARDLNNSSANEDLLILHLFEYVFEEEDADKAVYIKSGHLFDQEIMKHGHDNVIGLNEQYQLYTRNNGYEGYIKRELMRFRGQTYRDKGDISIVQSEYQLKPSESSGYSCSIHVRKELAFSRLLYKKEPAITNLNTNSVNNNSASANAKSVAMLVPSKNSIGKVEDCALVKYLLTSVLDSIENFNVTMYVGYDRDDPILKLLANRNWIKHFSRFEIKFIELPACGWLTFIWNVLFIEAYHDGNEFFIQLNDDIEFNGTGWLSSSINMMQTSKLRLVGFNDATWKCQLYTQTLVDRRHYTAFNGHYFPLELRNWYSDNWITWVYGRDGQGKCNWNAVISNGNVQTRYETCSDREYKKIKG